MLERVRKFIHKFDIRSEFFASIRLSQRILDLGCGTGINGTVLKELNPEIELHGVDLLPQNEVPSFYSYKIVDLDRGTLPYPNDYFDAIIFSHVLEHLRFPLQLGKEINRVMKKGGMIYIEVPNWITIIIPSFGFHREQHNPFNFYDDHTHIKPWSKQGLFEFLLQSCNLAINNVGTRRNWVRLPFDIPTLFFGLLAGKRQYVVSSVWNLFGWCIYGIGTKN
jgi:SAM-dependent methyltransferase